MFAGLGGFRIALESLGGRCVFSSDIDSQARKVYQHNHGDLPAGDITKIASEDIPKHDMICGGFPCQAFSFAGKGAGFGDPRGTLFYEMLRIADHHKPKYFFGENVKGLIHHDEGRSLATIVHELERIGYAVSWKLINAKHFVPQARERVYIVGVRGGPAFKFPELPTEVFGIGDVLEPNPDPVYTIRQSTWDALQKYPMPNGRGFNYHKILDLAKPSPTIICNTARKHLIEQPGELPRLLTNRERLRAFGYAESYELPVSRSAGTKLTGNTISPVVVRWIAEALLAK